MTPAISQQPGDFDDFDIVPVVQSTQRRIGSQRNNARPESPSRTQIGPKEAALITTRDSFHLATIGKNSWPYTQYRRGSKGFLRILDSTTLALADFRGGRQHLTCSVLLFLTDCLSQGRLKIWAATETSDDPKVVEKLTAWSGAATDRALLFHIRAFEWNFETKIVPFATKENLAQGLGAAETDNKTSSGATGLSPSKERARLASYVTLQNPADAQWLRSALGS